MTTMFVRHTVSSYQAWRKAYDEFAPVQKAKGVLAQAVYQATDNPNDITVTHDPCNGRSDTLCLLKSRNAEQV